MRERDGSPRGRVGRSAALTALAALAMLAASGCADATAPSGATSPSADASSVPTSAGPPATSGPAITSDPSASRAPDVACELSQQPGPGDVPEAGGETDTSDLGGGRWRVCLQVPLTVATEASAWCLWDEGRATVTEISGLPASNGTVDYDAWLSFAAPAFEFHATDTAHGGLIANYTTDAGPVHVQLDADGRGGIARFDVGQAADPESGPPPGAPARYGGLLRWRCGAAPTAA